MRGFFACSKKTRGGGGTAAPPEDPAPPSGTLLFNGDYSTGNLNQWANLQCKGYNGNPSSYPATYAWPVNVVTDAGVPSGYAAKMEVRNGDQPPSLTTGERSEVRAATGSDANSGDTRWYQFYVKFDSTFSQSHMSSGPGGWGFGTTNQWHSDQDGSPTVQWTVQLANGYWSLTITPQSSPGTYLAAGNSFSLCNIPIDNAWHKIKMCVLWSANDAVGQIKLWHNDNRVTFPSPAYGTRTDSNQTYVGRTMIPSQTTAYYKEGMYRSNGYTLTDIIYHSGCRIATSEAALTS